MTVLKKNQLKAKKKISWKKEEERRDNKMEYAD
jgi:hypothetical protein